MNRCEPKLTLRKLARNLHASTSFSWVLPFAYLSNRASKKTTFYIVTKDWCFYRVSPNTTDFSDFTNIIFSLLMKTDSVFNEEKQLELSRGPWKSRIKPDGPGTAETSRRDAPAQAWVWFSEINLSVFWQTAAGMGFLQLHFTPCCLCQNGVIV